MDPYDAIAAYYDLEHDSFEDDIVFYRQMLTTGPVLEVGVGTGRIAVPLARTGLEVWGIDSSEQMLTRAHARASGLTSLHLLHADAGVLRVDRRFRAAILPLNALWHFPDTEAQLGVLGAVRQHLDESGSVIIDLSNPHALDDRGAHGLTRVRFHASAHGDKITGYSAAWDDEGAQVLTLDLWYDRVASSGEMRRLATRLTLRYLYRAELELLLRLAGYRIDQIYGSYEFDPYDTLSPRLIAVARLA